MGSGAAKRRSLTSLQCVGSEPGSTGSAGAPFARQWLLPFGTFRGGGGGGEGVDRRNGIAHDCVSSACGHHTWELSFSAFGSPTTMLTFLDTGRCQEETEQY